MEKKTENTPFHIGTATQDWIRIIADSLDSMERNANTAWDVSESYHFEKFNNSEFVVSNLRKALVLIQEGKPLAAQTNWGNGRKRSLSDKQVKEAKGYAKAGMPVFKIARAFDVSPMTMHNAIKGLGAYAES